MGWRKRTIYSRTYVVCLTSITIYSRWKGFKVWKSHSFAEMGVNIRPLLELIQAPNGKHSSSIFCPSLLSVHPTLFFLAVKDSRPHTQRVLFSFQTGEDLQQWELFTGREYGGSSRAALQLSPEKKVTLLFQSFASSNRSVPSILFVHLLTPWI